MKKLFFYTLLLAIGILQSCSVTSEITYFKDSTFTTVMDVEAKELFGMAQAFSSDSADAKSFKELEELPKEWTSVYDLKLKEGKEFSKNPDSVRLMKKSFMKSKYENDELVGFAMKLEKFTQNEFENFSFLNSEKSKELGMQKQAFTQWNGKSLTIDSSDFNLDNPSEDEGMTPEEKAAEKAQMKQMLQMFDLKMSSTLKFENKIKSITGKHDWVKKIDDHTVAVTFDFAKMFDENPPELSNADKQIIITTE